MQLTPDKWDKVKELFEGALQQPRSERESFLDQNSPTPELRILVEKLLLSDDEASSFLARPLLSGHSLETTPRTVFAPGDLLASRFKILRFIAKGGVGEVYEAEDFELSEHVAIKTIRPDILRQPQSLQGFKREVNLARKVTHPNVCRIFDLFRHRRMSTGNGRRREDVRFVSMELLPGETLAERLKSVGAMTTNKALPIVAQIASALGAAHAVGVLHRDVKPGNVILVDQGTGESVRAVVTDFGLALNADTEFGIVSASDTTHGVLGTPAYMSPEQIEGQALTPATDIYALGLVIYEMVTGDRPFRGETPIASALKRLTETPPSPKIANPHLDSIWEETILKCLERQPANRFRSTDELVRALAVDSRQAGFATSRKTSCPVSVPIDYWKERSPFRSLQSFEPEDAWLFFGREAHTDELLARLAKEPVLTVVGNSGCGKSSLIKAGLIPALRQGLFRRDSLGIESWRIAVFRPSGTPFDYLAEILPSELAPKLSATEQQEFIATCRTRLPQGGDALGTVITKLTSESDARTGRERILLVVDQFEEIFTLTSDADIRRRYIDALLGASGWGRSVPVHLVLVLRADFYSNCLEHEELSRRLQTNIYNVPQMTSAQLRESIDERMRLAGAQAEPGLIDSLLEEVGTDPGNLALLEHALGQLWETRYGPRRVITNRAYEEIGRLQGALGKHADQVYENIGDERQKGLVQKIFLELVHLGDGVQDTRRRVRKEELLRLEPSEGMEGLLTRLISSRLLSAAREGNASVVEISHEALIRQWPALRDWLTQNREELGLGRRIDQAAEEWESTSRDSSALLQGVRLSQADEWLSRHPDSTPLIREFVHSGIEARADAARREHLARDRELAREQELRQQAEAQAEAERQFRNEAERRTRVEAEAAAQSRRSTLRLRRSTYALSILVLAAAMTTWVAYRQGLTAQSRALGAKAEQLAEEDQPLALALATRAWKTARTVEAHQAIADSFPSQLATLRGHTDSIRTAVFSSDGQYILTASDDRTARMWNASTGQLLVTLRGHQARVSGAVFAPDGQTVLTASDDATARVWSVGAGQLLATLRGHTSSVSRAVFSPDSKRILTASWDNTARVWSVGGGQLLATLRGHTGSVSTAVFSPDGRRILTASWDNTARLWDASSGQLQIILQGHADTVRMAVFSPDGQRVLTASEDGTARVWNAADGRLLNTLRGHSMSVSGAAFSPDGRRVLTASEDGTARVWSAISGKPQVTLQGHYAGISSATFSADGLYILTASLDHTARVWSASDGKVLAILRGHTGILSSAIFSRDGQRILTSSWDNTARVWSTTSAQVLTALQGDNGSVSSAVFSADGQRILTANNDNTARLWGVSNGRLITTLRGHAGSVRTAVFSHNGERILTASWDHTARVWSSNSGQLLATLQGHNASVSSAMFSPDDQRILTAGWDRTARVWNATSGQQLMTLEGHSGLVSSAVFSPDGQRILTASEDHTTRLWSSGSGQLLVTIRDQTGFVFSAAFSHDGHRIVTANWDHTARVWDASTGRLLISLQGHTDRVTSAVFSPDDQRILTASEDRTARVWSATGEPLAALQGQTSFLSSAEFSPDGQRIVTASGDQTVRIFRLVSFSDIAELLAK